VRYGVTRASASGAARTGSSLRPRAGRAARRDSGRSCTRRNPRRRRRGRRRRRPRRRSRARVRAAAAAAGSDRRQCAGRSGRPRHRGCGRPPRAGSASTLLELERRPERVEDDSPHGPRLLRRSDQPTISNAAAAIPTETKDREVRVEGGGAKDGEPLHHGELMRDALIRESLADRKRRLEVRGRDRFHGSSASANRYRPALGCVAPQTMSKEQPRLDEDVIARHEPLAAREGLLCALGTAVAA